VEAGDYYNSMLLKLEEYAAREAPNSCTPTVAVDGGELQWMSGYCLNRGLDR
jgi:hypothetical protein